MVFSNEKRVEILHLKYHFINFNVNKLCLTNKRKMKKAFRRLFKQAVYDSIPYDDLMLKQRFALFRIFALTGFAVSLMMAVQYYFVDPTAMLPPLLVVLALTIIASFYLTNDYRSLPVSYAISLSAAFLLMHFQP